MLPEGACTLAVERGECKRGRRRPIFGGGIKFDGIIFRGMKYSRGRKILRVSTLRARVVYMGAGGGWGPETRGPHGGGLPLHISGHDDAAAAEIPNRYCRQDTLVCRY
jgi:hypothetical protein